MDTWTILGGLLGGGFGSAFATFLLDRWKDRLASSRAWKQAALTELFGPLSLQMDRTQRAFKRYNATNTFLEAEVLGRGNGAVRDLLLAKAHFLAPELVEPAGRLIEHYDVWLEEYARVRKPDASPADGDTKLVFAGPKGFPFPRDAEKVLRDHGERLKRQLEKS